MKRLLEFAFFLAAIQLESVVRLVAALVQSPQPLRCTAKRGREEPSRNSRPDQFPESSGNRVRFSCPLRNSSNRNRRQRQEHK